jgi:hypothetical protein
MFRPICRSVVCILLASAVLCASAAAQQRFVLDAGDPAGRSSAVIAGGRLTIVDAAGNRFDYDRRRLQDSLDGRYLAFYSDGARQFVRFPVEGAGAMFIGTPRGLTVDWRRSQMSVHAVGADVVAPPIGVAPPVGVAPPLGPAPVIGLAPAAPQHFGLLAGPDGRFTLASVDEAGLLHYYQAEGDSWRHGESTVRDVLPAGAPLVLTTRGETRAAAYGVNARGELVEIADGRARAIGGAGAPRFVPGTHLASWTIAGESYLFAVDNAGRVWQIDPASGGFAPIERRGGFFEPGVPIAAVSGRGGDVFLVDRTGNLIGYSLRSGVWSRPYQVAEGFLSGGALAGDYVTTPQRTRAIDLAAVDASGRLRVLTASGADWADQSLSGFYLPPGAPVSLAAGDDGVHLSAIQSDGQWYEWYQSGDRWASRSIASGFMPGSQVLLHPAGPQAFAVDRTGRLVAGRWRDRRWQSALLSPDYRLSPLLEKRTIVPNAPLAPVEVSMENTHSEELVLRIFDARRPDRPIEMRIPAGGRLTQRLERDAGATLEEVHLLAAPGGQLVEDVSRYPLPPQQLYSVVVYANRVTSVYFDRTKNRTDTPDEESRSLVSLGVFPIPPGELVREGERFDVYTEARRQRNPGAAAQFDTPGEPPR